VRIDRRRPIGDADGDVAERVGCDVAAGNKTVALQAAKAR
jgi:hypothetical protein